MNKKLRIIWIIPNVFCYLMFIAVLLFVLMNLSGLKEIQMMPYWIGLLSTLFIVSLFGSLRIRQWIAQGKM